MVFVLHRFVLHNDRICEASEPGLSPGQVGLLSGWGVFTTIRVADGVLFAFDRHWARISRDAAALHVPLPTGPENVRRQLLELVEANNARNATLRLVIVRNTGGMWAGPSTGRPVVGLRTTPAAVGPPRPRAPPPTSSRSPPIPKNGAQPSSWPTWPTPAMPPTPFLAPRSSPGPTISLGWNRRRRAASTKWFSLTSTGTWPNARPPTSLLPSATRSGPLRSAPAACPASPASFCWAKSTSPGLS